MVHISVTGDTTGHHEHRGNSWPSCRPPLSRSIEWDPTLDPAWTKSLLLCSFTGCPAAVSGVTSPISDAFIIRRILSLTVIVDCLGGSLGLPRVLSPTGVLLQHIQLKSIPTHFTFNLLQGFISCSSDQCIIWGVVCVNKHEIKINFLIYSVFCNYCNLRRL